MTMIINPTATEFRAMLRGQKTFLADFYATWCGPCKMLSYVLADIEKEMGERIDIVKIDIDKAVSYTHLTLPTRACRCRSRWSPYH